MDDINYDINYYYNNRNVPLETFQEVRKDFREDFDDLNKNYKVSVTLTYLFFFTLYYNQYVEATTLRLFSNTIIYL